MVWYIHVNRNIINSNTKYGTNDPAVRVQRGKRGKAVLCHRVKMKDAELIYSAHNPILTCGARMVIVTENEPEILE